jgi:hypothetical protein
MNDAKKIAEVSIAPNGSYNYFDPSKFSEWQFDHIFVAPGTKVKRFGILNETYYDGEKFRYPFQRINARISSAGFPLGNGCPGDIERLRKLFLRETFPLSQFL